MKKYKCKCDICTKWSPLARRIDKKLKGRDKGLFQEFLMMEANQSDELCSANAKLSGDWTGWEWMKHAAELIALYGQQKKNKKETA